MDEIWKEKRPEPPSKPIRVHDLKYAGLDVVSKLTCLRYEVKGAGSSAIVISMLDEIAWLLNLVITVYFFVKFMLIFLKATWLVINL